MTARRPIRDGKQTSSGPVVGAGSTGGTASGSARRIAVPILAGIGGFAAPWVLFSTMDGRLPSMSPGTGDVLAGLVAIVGLVAASAIIHEVGHLVGARVAGFRTMVFGIWPIVLLRPAGRPWIVRVHPGLSWGLGLVLSVPTDTHDLRRRLIYVTGGGPGASALAGVVALVVFFFLTPDRAADSSAALTLALVAGAAGLISLTFALVTLLPVHPMTDGARLSGLLKGGEDADVQEALSVLVGLSVRGVRPRAWDPSLVERALAAPATSPYGLLSRQYAYESTLDRGDLTGARRLLNESLTAAAGSRGDQAALYLEAAWFAAVYDKDPTTARAWLTRAGARGLTEAHVRLIAEAAVLASEGRSGLAASRLHAAAQRLTSGRDVFGATDVARERIAHLSEAFGVSAPVPDAPRSP